MEKQIIIGYEEYLELERIRKEKNEGLANEFAVLIDSMHIFGFMLFQFNEGPGGSFVMQAINTYNEHPESKYTIEFTKDDKNGRVRIIKKNP